MTPHKQLKAFQQPSEGLPMAFRKPSEGLPKAFPSLATTQGRHTRLLLRKAAEVRTEGFPGALRKPSGCLSKARSDLRKADIYSLALRNAFQMDFRRPYGRLPWGLPKASPGSCGMPSGEKYSQCLLVFPGARPSRDLAECFPKAFRKPSGSPPHTHTHHHHHPPTHQPTHSPTHRASKELKARLFFKIS